MPGPKIAILGAGPAGLTLARLLQQNGIECIIYEGDADRHARTQGGSLDLRPDSGQRAIRAAGLMEEFRRRSRPEGQALKLVKADGAVVLDENTGPGRVAEFDDRPEIDRHELRDMLLDSVAPGSLRWGHRVVRVEEDSGERGKHRLIFEGGRLVEGFDLVVGADGAWSKARPLVTSARPFYSGITMTDICVRDVSRVRPWLARYVGGGGCFMFDEGRAVMCQHNGGDTLRVYVSVRQPETWREDCGVDWGDGEAVRRMFEQEYFVDCGDDVRRSIRDAVGECVARPLYMMPVGHRWESRAGITLVGDAAHLFTPFAGEGVNLAMTDAAELAQKVIARKESLLSSEEAAQWSYHLEAAIREYESEMFVRATILATKTANGLRNHFSKDGAEEMASRLTGRPQLEIQQHLQTPGRPMAVA